MVEKSSAFLQCISNRKGYMNPKRLVLYIIFCCCICIEYSIGQVFPIDQPYDIDSLQRVLRVAKDDADKVWTYLCLSETYSKTDIEKSLAAAESAKVLAERLDSQSWLALSFLLIK